MFWKCRQYFETEIKWDLSKTMMENTIMPTVAFLRFTNIKKVQNKCTQEPNESKNWLGC